MDRLITSIGTLKRVELKDVKEKAIALWVASFVEDTPAFAEAYFNYYIRFVSSYFFVNGQNELVLMAFNTNEGYAREKATLIEGIAVDKRFQGKGIMSVFMDQWIKDLEHDYHYVFIQAYNWNIYKKYDFRDFNSNHLWSYTPLSSEPSKVPGMVFEYSNEPLSDMQRSPLHRTTYFECMRLSDARLLSYQSASLVLTGDYAVNVTFKKESDLSTLLRTIGKKITFLLPDDLAVELPGFEIIEKNRLETKLYKRNLTGRFNYIY